MGQGKARSGTAASLARLFERLPLAAAILASDGTIATANPAFAKTLGHPEGRAPADLDALAHADDTGALSLHLMRLVRGEAQDYRAEHRLAHADGSALWVVVSACREADGPVLVQLTDIDRLKRAEAALAYAECRWNSALECSGQGVWEHDIRRDTMFYSRMWKLMRGFSPDEEIDGDNAVWLARMHPEDRARIRAVVDKQDQGIEGFHELEYRERRRDGRYIWILSRGKPVAWDEDGNPVRTIGTDTDITRLKTTETALAEERERLRVTLHSIGDGVISTDRSAMIVFMNPAAARLTGWDATAAIGRPIEEVFVIRSEDRDVLLGDPVQSCLATGRPVAHDEDVVLVARGGSRRDIRCAASLLGDRSGTGAVLVFQDVSQSRALQRQLQHAASHDGLTGLANRAAFDLALENAVASAGEGAPAHALLYVDLDHFKPVNDTAGHAAGDEMLRRIAKTIRASCRGADVAARIGGDEFAVLLEGCPLENARAVGEAIAKGIAALELGWGDATHRVGASVGMTRIGREPPSALGFLGEADAACYAAKYSGGGKVVAYGDIARPPRSAARRAKRA